MVVPERERDTVNLKVLDFLLQKYDVAKSDEPINININTKKGCTIKVVLKFL